MKTLMVYEASDGSYHTTPEKCLLHEKTLAEDRVDEGVRYFVAKHWYSEPQHIQGYVEDVLIDNRKELHDILNGDYSVPDNWEDALNDEE